jgi:hypothetical protein
MTVAPDFRIGPHQVSVRKVAGRWTAAVDGKLMPGFFGTEAQASGAALVAIASRERDHVTLEAGDTLAFRTLEQVLAMDAGRAPAD